VPSRKGLPACVLYALACCEGFIVQFINFQQGIFLCAGESSFYLRNHFEGADRSDRKN
jgi:hypothetical protein